jgi:hypothetical protein
VDGVVHNLIEVKEKDSVISSALKYYAKSLKPKRAIQIVGDLKRSFDQDEIHVTSPIAFFANSP